MSLVEAEAESLTTKHVFSAIYFRKGRKKREPGLKDVVLRCDKGIEEIIAILLSWRLGLDSRLHSAC